MSKKLDVELYKPLEGNQSLVELRVWATDGKPMTGQQILEAVSEALLMYWEHNPMEEMRFEDYNA